MLSHHTAELLAKFDELFEVGVTTVTPIKLLLWYDRDRITRAVWRDLATRWRNYLEDSDDAGVPLMVGENSGGATFALVWGEGLTTNGNYFVSVDDLADPVNTGDLEDIEED
jgi:hypothetical protein